MIVLRWLKSLFSRRGKALAIYRRGMRLAKNRDHKGAIGEYTTAIDMEAVPTDVKAMALFNRALMHSAVGNDRSTVDDLEAVLAMDKAPQNVKTMARHKLVKRDSRKRNQAK